MSLLIAIVLGLIEGITEFLPISSTGHLIVAGHLLGFTGEGAETFEIFIQLGAILAVVWEYRAHLLGVARGALASNPDPVARRLIMNLALAFLPAALAGFLLHRVIKDHLFDPVIVGAALIAGGVAMILIERARPRVTVTSLMAIPWRKGLLVGVAQTASLVPGVSRAAATIMGGMLCGLDRTTATVFSFYLAIPTMLAATLYDLAKTWSLLSGGDLGLIAAGFVVAFLSALAAVRAFVRFISRHDFTPFAWYRIALGVVTLILFL